MSRFSATALLASSSRWLFLGLLVFAPWDYGSTRPWSIETLNALIAAVLILWCASCLLRPAWPFIPRPCVWLGALLLLEAGWMAFNAKAYLGPAEDKIVALENAWAQWPGSIERDLSLAALRRFVGLVGIIWFTCDLSSRPIWRNRLWTTAGLTGLSIVLFGLIERVAKAPMIFWETDRTSGTFFATYFYHANAGAFINLVLPLTAGLALAAAAEKPKPQLRLAFWSAATLIVIGGAFVNFSRGAQATTVTLILAFGGWQLREALARRAVTKRQLLLAIALVALLLVPIALLGWNSTSARWIRFPQDLSTDGRHFASRVTLRMAADAGAFGFGPGTFRIGFPFYIAESEHPEGVGVWRYAHEDYLQTYVEWGWFGAALWVGLFGGGLGLSLHTYFHDRRKLASSDRILLFTSSLALVGIALHALIDFPLQIASLQLYAAVYLGLGWGSRQWIERRSRPREEMPKLPHAGLDPDIPHGNVKDSA